MLRLSISPCHDGRSRAPPPKGTKGRPSPGLVRRRPGPCAMAKTCWTRRRSLRVEAPTGSVGRSNGVLPSSPTAWRVAALRWQEAAPVGRRLRVDAVATAVDDDHVVVPADGPQTVGVVGAALAARHDVVHLQPVPRPAAVGGAHAAVASDHEAAEPWRDAMAGRADPERCGTKCVHLDPPARRAHQATGRRCGRAPCRPSGRTAPAAARRASTATRRGWVEGSRSGARTPLVRRGV